jgi:hypothetical protein
MSGLWCYTTDKDTRWERCDAIPYTAPHYGMMPRSLAAKKVTESSLEKATGNSLAAKTVTRVSTDEVTETSRSDTKASKVGADSATDASSATKTTTHVSPDEDPEAILDDKKTDVSVASTVAANQRVPAL